VTLRSDLTASGRMVSNLIGASLIDAAETGEEEHLQAPAGALNERIIAFKHAPRVLRREQLFDALTLLRREVPDPVFRRAQASRPDGIWGADLCLLRTGDVPFTAVLLAARVPGLGVDQGYFPPRMLAILGYESRLKRAGLLDATSVLQAAAWTVGREIETCAMRPSDAHGVVFLFIDEAQDLSLPYMRLIGAIRALNGSVVVQAVGDDWEAINGFAGADLEYFARVEEHFEDPLQLDLLRNRRSGSKIVSWVNRVMTNAGYSEAPAIPSPERGEGEVSRSRVSGSTDWRFAASRLADLVDPDMAEVALIARRWKAGDYPLPQLRGLVEASLRERGYAGKVTATTAHGSKGLE